MRDVTKDPEAPAPPLAPADAPADGPECSICGAPMWPPAEIGHAIDGALNWIGAEMGKRLEVARAAGVDEATEDALLRQWTETAAGHLFPKLKEWSAELMGAHASCVAKVTRARRGDAS